MAGPKTARALLACAVVMFAVAASSLVAGGTAGRPPSRPDAAATGPSPQAEKGSVMDESVLPATSVPGEGTTAHLRVQTPRSVGGIARGGSGSAARGPIVPTTSALPTTPPAPIPTTTTTEPAPVVRAVGIDQWRGRLYRDGMPFGVIGLNAPQAATLWSANHGCGAQMSDAELDQMFTSVPAGTVIGFWATQAMAYNNRTTNQIDFAGIDRVFAAAERHGRLLAPALETQQGYCSDGHFKDEAWYGGQYRVAFNDDGRGLQKLSYWDYLHLIVPRYRASKALAWWVPVTEPETSTCAPGRKGADCYAALSCSITASGTLRRFFDDVGGEIVRLDPNHLLSSATIGGGQCGTEGDQYAFVHSSPALGICEVHDYDNPAVLSEGMRAAIQRCRAAGKAFIAGEVGLSAGQAPGCETTARRRDRVVAHADAMKAAGGSGLLLWQWLAEPTPCGWGVGPGDPVLAVAGPR